MAYMIHITRDLPGLESVQEIALQEWVDAVNSIEGVRLAEGDYPVRLPETGQTFILRNNGGDTELHIPHANAWRRTFRWEEGVIKFVGTEEFTNDPACRLRTIARALAAALGAVMCGDDGRIHD